MSKPDHSPPRLCPAAPPKLGVLRRRCSLSAGRRSLWRRVGCLSQLLARVIARHSLPLTQEVDDD